MYYSDSISKGFLEAGTYVPYLSPERAVNRWTEYEDPTYLGFYVRFWFEPKGYGPDGIGMDYMPQGLLLDDPEDPKQRNKMPLADSAQAYLRRRNEFYRAKMLRDFREGLRDITFNTPWMFQKITGLGDLWKIDPKINWRAKEKKIVIECLETISLKMTYLADLYRKAAWDSAYHRWILPDVQRFFSMEIIVTEMRSMQRMAAAAREIPSEENSLLNVLTGAAANNSALNKIANSNAANALQSLLNRDNDTPPVSFWSTGTFIKFDLDYCEFDFFSEGPPILENVSSTPQSEPATAKLTINVGRVSEVNSYGLLGALLEDTYSANDRGALARDTNFGGPNQQQTAGSLEALKTLDVSTDFLQADSIRAARAAERRKTAIGLANSKSLTRGGGGATTGAPPNPLIPDFDLGLVGKAFPGLEQRLDTAVQAANAAVQNFGTKPPDLGNVYGLTPAQIATLGQLAEGGNVAGQFLQNFGFSQQSQAELGNAFYTTTPEETINIVDPDGLIGKANSFANFFTSSPPELVQGFLGAIELMSDAVAGTPLQGQTVGDIIAIVASQNLQGQPAQTTLDGAQINTTAGGNVNLQAPSILNTALGQILFEGTLPSASPGGKVVLSAAEIQPATERVVELKAPKKSMIPGESEVPLEGATPSMEAPGNVPQESAPVETTTDEKVMLTAAPTDADSSRRVDQESPKTAKAFPQQQELNEARVAPETKQDRVNLVEPEISNQRLKSVDLESPTVSNQNLGNIDLEEPNPANPKLGTINLEEPPIDKPKLGNVDLT